MKRHTLLKHLRRYGCYLKREGKAHSLYVNPLTGHTEAIPRHTEIPEKLAKKDMSRLVNTRNWLINCFEVEIILLFSRKSRCVPSLRGKAQYQRHC